MSVSLTLPLCLLLTSISLLLANSRAQRLLPGLLYNGCDSSPCRNNGLCFPLVFSYRCSCPLGWRGFDCTIEMPRDACSYYPCRNGGSCTQNLLTPLGYTCWCVGGWVGRDCTQHAFIRHTTNGSSSCGGILNDASGVIRSPNYPNVYPEMADCSWLITANSGERIALSFTDFQIEDDNTCNYDYVTIDGVSSSRHTKNSRYCGRIPEHVLLSADSSMAIRFRTDSSVALTGFQLNYQVVNSESPCSWFSCQNGGQCVWNGTNSSSSYLCSCTDGWDGLLCTEPNSNLSLSTTTQPGFPTTDFFIYSCGGILNTATGMIQSPNYPNLYPNNVYCTWQIIAEPGQRVTLSFRNFQTEAAGCSYDYVRISGSASSRYTRISKYCGIIPDHTLISTNNSLTIQFSTDGSVQSTGFQLDYEIVDSDSPCYYSPCQNGGRCSLDESSSSPSYFCNCPEGWGGSNCTQSNSTFSTQVFNEITTTMWPFFTNTSPGFNTTGPITCGGSLNTTVGTIRSPNYPDNYPSGISCTWQITVEVGQRINLTFSSFQTESHSSCSYDYMTIEGATSSQFTNNFRYCGSIPAHSVLSTNNTMMIRFRSDGSVTSSGFELNYVSMDADA